MQIFKLCKKLKPALQSCRYCPLSAWVEIYTVCSRSGNTGFMTSAECAEMAAEFEAYMKNTVQHILKIRHFCGKYDLFITDWTLQVLCCQQGLGMVRCWRCHLQFVYIFTQWACHSIGDLCFDYEGGGNCGKIWTWPWTSNKFFQSSCCWWNFLFFRHVDLAGTMNRKLWTWNWLLFCQKHKVLDYTAVNF